MKAVSTISLQQLAISAIVAVTGDALTMPDLQIIPVDQVREYVRSARRKPVMQDQTMVKLAKALDFEDFELIVLALLRAVETDPGACRLVGAAQAPLAGARPMLGLLATAFHMFGPVDSLMTLLSSGKAEQSGCIVIGAEEAPLPERSLRIARPILDALEQSSSVPQGLRFLAPSARALPQAILDEAKKCGERLVARPSSGIVIRANSETEALAAAGSVAFQRNQKAALVMRDIPAYLPAWLVASQTVPVFYAYVKPGERFAIPDLLPYTGPWLCVTNRDGIVESPSSLVTGWTLPPSAEAARITLWQANGIDLELARQAAKSFRIGHMRIAKLAAAAVIASSVAAEKTQWKHITQVVALDAQSSIAGLAQRIEGRINDDAFIRPKQIIERLQLLLGRCRLREGLAGHLGPASSARYHAGVRALFHGASGTGKSLAAQWLATALDLPVYRVDLAAVTSKWIGETEKNIGQLLSAAEESDVILLFDEADSLFSARTDVGNSNDRHANSQTNYLLQRLESHEGIVILTSNARDRLDGAFTRRLDAIIEFPMPELEARRDIWRAHLPKDGLPEQELNHLAAVIDLAGGHVRNLVLSAAVLAKGEAPTLPHLIAAAKAEYQKLGRQVPRELELT